MIYSSIRARLLSSTEFSTRVAERVFRLRAPQNAARPYVTMQQISRVPVVALSGDTKTYFARYQISIVDDEPGDASELAAIVRSLLSGWQDAGGEGSPTIRMDLINEIDQFDPLPGADAGLTRIIQDYEANFYG